MSQSERQAGRVLAFDIPRWLNWRSVGLLLVMAVAILVLALISGDGDEEPAGSAGLYARLKNISHLSTVEIQLSTVVQIVNPRKLRGDEVLVYGVCGRVVAGLDLSKVQPQDIQWDGRSIRVRLPQAEIFSLDILLEDATRTVPPFDIAGTKHRVEVKPVCEHTFSWETPVGLTRTPELVTNAQEEALKAFKRTAEDNGILTTAQIEAEKQLEKMLLLAGYDNIQFETDLEIQPRQE